MTDTYEYYVDQSKPWLQPEAGWPEQVPKNYHFPRMTLYEMLSHAVEKSGDQNAIWFLNSFMTYKELLANVDALATSFHNMGLRKGDVVALVLPSSFQYVITYYACVKLGLIVTGVNPTYKPGEVLHELNLTEAKTVVVLDALYQPLIA
ncbi:MAG: AMP-binding protein, partial [Deltaproteobacteria bacterium]